MSRGPGKLHRKILAELRAARGLLPWDTLAERFPRQARDHSLHRGVRSLRRMRRLREVEVSGQRWLANCAPPVGKSQADRDRIRMAEEARGMLAAAAEARGAPVLPIETPRQSLDAYREGRKLRE